MVRGSDGMGLAYVHPNALNHSWDLKLGGTPKEPAGTTPGIRQCHNHRGARCRGTMVYNMGRATPQRKCMVSSGYSFRV